MNSIPRFTAEASLERSEVYFVGEISAARGAEEVVAHTITAQFIHRPVVDCDFLECIRQRGYLLCWCG